jgi:glycosyltransferase involved in cell wall biosynthesis
MDRSRRRPGHRASSPALSVTRSGARLGLILHYLPWLLDRRAYRETSPWPAAELAALRAAQAFLVTSPFMGEVVRRLVDGSRPVLHVQPGRLARRPAALPQPPVRAVMVANLVPGKRVAEFLGALGGRLRDADQFQLRIVGGASLAPAYAQRCREMVAGPSLRGQVELVGELPPEATVREMAAGNLMLSASIMESYGMALAEARTLGLPIMATAGGNVARQVEREAGGELLGEPAQLAEACLALARNPDEHRRRMAVARASAWPARSWPQAADDWVREARGLRVWQQQEVAGRAG